MTRMFKSIDQTWNVWVGCLFNCSYCNARKAALTRFKHIERYKDGFKPHLVESELNRKFKPGQFIFVAYMGDISFASTEEVNQITTRIRQFPKSNFLLCTKDPSCFQRWHLNISPNIYLGTTIETNRDYNLTKAPAPIERFRQLTGYPHNAKFLSIEPIMDFDLDHLLGWVGLLQPDIIEVGYDNYNNHLIEPKLDKTLELIQRLEQFTKVVRKTIRKAWNNDCILSG